MKDRYREYYATFRWYVPERFNIADVCGRRWAAESSRIAIHAESADGKQAVYTYAALQSDANRLSNALRALGVARGDRVALVLPQCAETAVAHLALYQLGAIAMPLSILFGADALEYRLRDSGAIAAVVDAGAVDQVQALRSRLPQLAHVIAVHDEPHRRSDWNELLSRASDRFDPVSTSADDPALLIYTSGTTGPPKGALLPHRALLGNLPGLVASQNWFPRPGDVFWSPADWAWTGGLMDALLPTLYFGFPIVAYRGRFEPERALALMQRHGVTCSFLFPTALKMIMKQVPRPLARYPLRLRAVMSAGEAVGHALFDWAKQGLGVTINEMFGQTETNYIVGNSHQVWPARAGSIGRPYPGHRVAVIDDDGNEARPGEVGEIALHRRDIHGDPDPVMFLGYWNDPQAGARKFAGDWFRTGDLASRDDDGYLWYQGRTDDMFKSAGYRIGPGEIENCLLSHPSVANVAVVPKPDAERGALVKAFVVLAPGASGGPALVAQLQQHVRERLAPYEYPKEIEFLEQLPMTTTGKLQRRVLRELEIERSRAAANPQGTGAQTSPATGASRL